MAFFSLLFPQNHEWVKKADLENVDIAGWVCRTMELLPATPTRIAPIF
jgi:mitogen-activated protein kinase kinase 1